MAEAHTYRVRDRRVAHQRPRANAKPSTAGDTESVDAGLSDADYMAAPREVRVVTEIERQRAIYRIGTSEEVLKRAAISALMERGEY